jgi:aspartate racemase
MITGSSIHEMRTIGIVGGMGPYAGIELMREIFDHTEAVKDQEHIPVVHISMPGRIVDRTAFLTGKTDINPAQSICRVIGRLERAGAEVVGIPCNTSHTKRIFSVIAQELHKMESSIKLINMVEETGRFLKSRYADGCRIGVLSTNGTHLSNVYYDMLQESGFEAVVPDWDFQNDVIHRCVYDPSFGIKAISHPVTAGARELLKAGFGYFRERGADVVILGCTELSFAVRGMVNPGIPMVDAMRILARSLVMAAAPFKLKEETQQIVFQNL